MAVSFKNHFNILKILTIIVLFNLNNCQLKDPDKTHGINYLKNRANQLIIAKSNKNDVIKLFGTPHVKSISDENEWMYFERVLTKGNLHKLNDTKMANGILVKDNLVNLIAKIGEKITIRRANFFDNLNGKNFAYVHSAIEKGIGKIISVVKLGGTTNEINEDFGIKVAMHIAASNPLAIEKDKIDKVIVDKELEIIKAEIANSGKPAAMVDKISKGKISKFLNDNSLLNQLWIMDPKKKVSDILKEKSSKEPLQILDFIRYKVGEGI